MPFFDAFKKGTRNEQNIRDHRKNLILQFNEYTESSSNVDSNLEEVFHHVPNNESILCHLATGYNSTFLLLTDYILLKLEIDTQIISESIWREKTKRAYSIGLEFNHEFEKLLLKIVHGSEEFEGICEQCKKWYNEDDPNSKELISKLNIFKMPF
jgi:hypothetical protein